MVSQHFPLHHSDRQHRNPARRSKDRDHDVVPYRIGDADFPTRSGQTQPRHGWVWAAPVLPTRADPRGGYPGRRGSGYVTAFSTGWHEKKRHCAQPPSSRWLRPSSSTTPGTGPGKARVTSERVLVNGNSAVAVGSSQKNIPIVRSRADNSCRGRPRKRRRRQHPIVKVGFTIGDAYGPRAKVPLLRSYRDRRAAPETLHSRVPG